MFGMFYRGHGVTTATRSRCSCHPPPCHGPDAVTVLVHRDHRRDPVLVPPSQSRGPAGDCQQAPAIPSQAACGPRDCGPRASVSCGSAGLRVGQPPQPRQWLQPGPTGGHRPPGSGRARRPLDSSPAAAPEAVVGSSAAARSPARDSDGVE